MHEHTTIPLPHPQRLTEAPCTEIVRQGAGSVRDVARHCDRAMYHMVSRVKSGGGMASPLAVAGRITCKDASLFEVCSCPWRPSSPIYKLRENERPSFSTPEPDKRTAHDAGGRGPSRPPSAS